MEKKKLYVWYGEKATYDEKSKWKAVRKLLYLADECVYNLIEVKSKSELDELEKLLTQSGLVIDTSNPTTLNGRLKIWK
jgi:hypothetical protein